MIPSMIHDPFVVAAFWGLLFLREKPEAIAFLNPSSFLCFVAADIMHATYDPSK
jgi:hypothetical protein